MENHGKPWENHGNHGKPWENLKHFFPVELPWDACTYQIITMIYTCLKMGIAMKCGSCQWIVGNLKIVYCISTVFTYIDV